MSANFNDDVVISDDGDDVDDVDFQSTAKSEQSLAASSYDNFVEKYVFKPGHSSFNDKLKKTESPTFDHQFGDYASGASTFDLFEDKKGKDLKSFFQDFELPSLKKEEKKASLPVIAATRIISGVSVQLPVIPYPAQLSVMDKVIKGITHGENCLIESPTGSGKTLALLCSSLAWQKQERERVEKLLVEAMTSSYLDWEVPEASNHPTDPPDVQPSDPIRTEGNPATPPKRKDNVSKKKSKKPVYVDDSDDDNVFVKKLSNKKGSCCQDKGEELTNFNKNNGKNEKIIHSSKRKETSPENSESDDCVMIHKKPKIINNLAANHQDASSNPDPSKNVPDGEEQHPAIPRVPRIIFGTRTHKQIEQVIKELKRTIYSNNLKMSILSSREHTCIKHLPREYSSKTKHCKALMDKAKILARQTKTKSDSGCEYLNNKAALIGKRAPQDVWDIEDLVKLGNSRAACPYFAARDLADFAHIVFCPYNYIIDPIIRSSIQLNLEGNIILVDEGHNIEDICRDTASLVIDVANIQECIKELEEIMKIKPLSKEDNNDLFIYFKTYFHNWEDLFHNHLPLLQKQSSSESTYIMDGEALADTLQRHSIGYRQFNDLKVRVNAALIESRNVKPEDITKRTIHSGTASLLESIVVIFDYFFKDECKHLDNYNGIFTKKSEWSRGVSDGRVSYCLRVSCMDPSLVFSEISTQARCVVLSSGTLTPVLSFSSELGTPFQHTLQARHVIRHDQVWVGTIDSGPNGMPLEATYKNTSSVEWQDSLGQIILWISQKVPNGVLCFLSSYRLIETLQERWESTGLWQKLQEHKYVFTESKSMTEHDQIMTDFYSSVIEGAILFAVFRGKVSEGMDFRDHQARAVITVGIPYANVKDPMVDGKMKYNNAHQIDKKLVSGRDWYSIQAFRALNQALGRCVRHKNDWGAIIMVDSRFRKDSMKQHISKWVLSFLGNQHHDWHGLTQGINNLERFMNNMKLQQSTDTTL